MKKLVYIIPILVLLYACSAQKEFVEIPVETVKTEYVYSEKIDSVYIRDSIDKWINGDTFFIYKEHTKYKYINRVDTITKIDSVPKIIEVETIKEVEVSHLKWYQEGLMWVGKAVLTLLGAFLIYKLKFK